MHQDSKNTLTRLSKTVQIAHSLANTNYINPKNNHLTSFSYINKRLLAHSLLYPLMSA
ncbi:MAG: hypothetical protein HN842_01095 [Gammaproteobacteria bacterium]|nr:hypothetical protein [Gammaproteobacteria bacterium]MBT7306779.1 hypothetical protein [Gammaproteobacteria bacterium]